MEWGGQSKKDHSRAGQEADWRAPYRSDSGPWDKTKDTLQEGVPGTYLVVNTCIYITGITRIPRN